MVRVRANAKRTKYQNEGGETSNPPTQREIGEGESLNSQTQREIKGGETSNAPTHGEIRGEETSNPPSPREIGGEETLNSASSREIRGEETTARNEIGVTIDPDLLDCSICTNPLCPPLYQCILGHVACLSCWEKVQNKCPTCNKPIGGQNIALEKVLESIHLPCPNANLGCHQSVSYSQMQMHTKMCEFGPSLCPIPGCAHKAFSGEWRAHFLKDHREPGCYYGYGRSCTVTLNEEDLYYTFLGPGKDVFLLVQEPIPNVGNVLSLFYVDLTDPGQNNFSYELHEYMTGSSYKSPDVVSIKEWKRGEVHGSSLLVPSWRYKASVLINKKRNVFSSD